MPSGASFAVFQLTSHRTHQLRCRRRPNNGRTRLPALVNTHRLGTPESAEQEHAVDPQPWDVHSVGRQPQLHQSRQRSHQLVICRQPTAQLENCQTRRTSTSRLTSTRPIDDLENPISGATSRQACPVDHLQERVGVHRLNNVDPPSTLLQWCTRLTC